MRSAQKDFQTLAAFRYALRRFLRFSEEAAARVGLTPQQHQALLAIHGFPGRDRVTVSELAERLQLAHHSVVGIIDRLAKSGLVVRERSREDKRQVWVEVSAKGRGVLGKLTAAHKRQLVMLGPDLVQALTRLTPRKPR